MADQLDMDPDQLLGNAPDSWIVGDVDRVAERLHELAEAGVDRVMCQHLVHRDTEFVALLGRQIAPLISAETGVLVRSTADARVAAAAKPNRTCVQTPLVYVMTIR